jgi:deazaflavin-dependent oxidoreductase (nitroreductase family)
VPEDFNSKVIAEFNESNGIVGGHFEGRPIALVTVVGARSGTKRTVPLIYLEDEGRIFVFASKAGAPENPAWYHNVVANPEVVVEVGTRQYDAQAVEIRGSERDRLYSRQGEILPDYIEYQAKTDRVIPVVELRPAAYKDGKEPRIDGN